MRRLRIGTLNVHSLSDAKGNDNRSRLISLLRAQDLDVIAFQEATCKRRFNAVEEIAEALCLPYWMRNDKEMAILSKYPMDLIPLPSHAWVFKRVLCVIVHHEDFPTRVINVHLDYKFESTRQREMKNILSTAGKGHPTFLIGDFNALCEGDYSREEWDEISCVRSRNLWEDPTSRLMNSLTAHEWSDCRGLSPKNKLFGLNGTCRFDTRVDYALADARFLTQYSVKSSLHMKNNTTDHALVVTEFQKSKLQATPND